MLGFNYISENECSLFHSDIGGIRLDSTYSIRPKFPLSENVKHQIFSGYMTDFKTTQYLDKITQQTVQDIRI